jgi:DNA-binding transcriptional ArsR family regulator
MIDAEQTELLGHIAGRFRALGDVTRLRLLLELRGGPQSVTALTQRLRMAQAGVSKHLGVLRAAGLVEPERRKNQIFHHVADARVFDMCAVVCDGVFKQIKSQQTLLAATPVLGRTGRPARQRSIG